MANFSQHAQRERDQMQAEIEGLKRRMIEHETQRDQYRDEIRLSAESVQYAIGRELGRLEHRGQIAEGEISTPYGILMEDIERLRDAEEAIANCKDMIADHLATLADDDVWLEVA